LLRVNGQRRMLKRSGSIWFDDDDDDELDDVCGDG
jgi:hypothetical protein